MADIKNNFLIPFSIILNRVNPQICHEFFLSSSYFSIKIDQKTLPKRQIKIEIPIKKNKILTQHQPSIFSHGISRFSCTIWSSFGSDRGSFRSKNYFGGCWGDWGRGRILFGLSGSSFGTRCGTCYWRKIGVVVVDSLVKDSIAG